jgi:hypothetical protein
MHCLYSDTYVGVVLIRSIVRAEGWFYLGESVPPLRQQDGERQEGRVGKRVVIAAVIIE